MFLIGLTAAVLAADPLPGEAAVVADLHAGGGFLRAGSDAVSAATGTEAVAVAAAVVSVLLLLRHRARDAGVVLGAVAAAVLIGAVLKEVVERPRPELAVAAEVSPYAYPSGHTTGATALVLALALVLRLGRRWYAVIGLVALVTVSVPQLALGRHHPTDLLAGWLLALACAAGAAAALRRAGPTGAPRQTPSGRGPDGR